MKTSPESPALLASPGASCQKCGLGCHHAASLGPTWQGDWIWCEDPERQSGARLVRADCDCYRFDSHTSHVPR